MSVQNGRSGLRLRLRLMLMLMLRIQSRSAKGEFLTPFLTHFNESDNVSDMKVTSREFQRNFAKLRKAASAGTTIHLISGDEEFIFQRVSPRTWQGALKGKVKITGDLHSTGLEWESAS